MTSTTSAEVATDAEGVEILARWAEQRSEAVGLDANGQLAVRLCIEEAATNVVMHAHPNPTGHWMRLEDASDGEMLRLVLVDDGGPFDPTSAQDPARDGSIEEATVGGRGLRLMRAFSQAMRYERRGGRNRLALEFRHAPAPGR